MAKDAEKLAAQAQRISELRAAKRVTQPDAADAVGVTLRAYQAWEAGDSGVGPQNLKRLAAYFGTTPDYLEYGAEREHPLAPSLMGRLQPEDLGEHLAAIDHRLARLQAVLDHLAGEEVVAAALRALEPEAPPRSSKRRPQAA